MSLFFSVGLGPLISLGIFFILLSIEAKFLVEKSLAWKLGFGFLNAVCLGLVWGIMGFLLGASVPDESAGEAAVMLFFIGLGLGLTVAGIFSTLWFVFWK
jgi:hypothetical protein